MTCNAASGTRVSGRSFHLATRLGAIVLLLLAGVSIAATPSVADAAAAMDKSRTSKQKDSSASRDAKRPGNSRASAAKRDARKDRPSRASRKSQQAKRPQAKRPQRKADRKPSRDARRVIRTRPTATRSAPSRNRSAQRDNSRDRRSVTNRSRPSRPAVTGPSRSRNILRPPSRSRPTVTRPSTPRRTITRPSTPSRRIIDRSNQRLRDSQPTRRNLRPAPRSSRQPTVIPGRANSRQQFNQLHRRDNNATRPKLRQNDRRVFRDRSSRTDNARKLPQRRNTRPSLRDLDRRPQASDRKPQANDRRPNIFDRRPQTHDRRPDASDRRPQAHDRRPQQHREPDVHEHRPSTHRHHGWKGKHSGYGKKSHHRWYRPRLIGPRHWKHRHRRSSIWFSFHFSDCSWFHAWQPRYSVTSWCPTWHYTSAWRPVYIRPLARPIYQISYSTTYYNTTTTAPAAPVEPEPLCAYTEVQAWEFLAANQLDLAMQAFACLAREEPYDGLQHVGYALANAMAGAHESAAAVMRHAAQFDVQSLQYVPADEQLDQHLHALLAHYGERATQPGNAGEALFMIAALRTILTDHAGAYFAVTESIAHSGSDDASAALKNLLADSLAAQMHQAQ